MKKVTFKKDGKHHAGGVKKIKGIVKRKVIYIDPKKGITTGSEDEVTQIKPV